MIRSASSFALAVVRSRHSPDCHSPQPICNNGLHPGEATDAPHQTNPSRSNPSSTVAAHSQSTPTPTLKVYSRETIVDTTLTDKKGDPVHGLEKSNFTLKEDNDKPQPIRGFQEYSTQTLTTPPPKLPPNVYTNLQPPSPSSAVNILLVDLLNIASMPGIDVLGAERTQRLAQEPPRTPSKRRR